MKLDLYNKKRNFKITKEPQGKLFKKQGHLFVIQKHAASHLHYDFRLELHGVLLSWAVPKGPCLDPTVKRLAMHVEDHPLAYGNFEGIIPKGQYGGGTVMLWDKGIWIPLDEDAEAAYKAGHLRFNLEAQKLKGRFSLIRSKKDSKSWFLIKAKDRYARSLQDYDITQKKPNSVKSKLTLDEIAENAEAIWSKKGLEKSKKKVNETLNLKNSSLSRESYPEKISPHLATLVDQAPMGASWLHEMKFDGYRMLTFKKDKITRLISRNNHDWTAYFSNVHQELKQLKVKQAILDGEVVLLDKSKRPNFQLLQNAIKNGKNNPFIYYIFDVLHLNGFNLRPLPLIKRKEILKKILPQQSLNLRYSDYILGQGEKVFKEACKLGFEGIISKKKESPYEQRKSKTWLKVKCIESQEFVIGGYSKPQGNRQYFGSLFLGYYDKKGQLKYCGNVGTGFNEASLKSIYKALQKYKTTINPFDSNPPGVKTAIWVEPQLVAEIAFTERTQSGTLRHPSFKGLRIDKPAKTIGLERKVRVKNSKI